VVLCTTVVHNDMHTRAQFLNLRVHLGLDFVRVCLFRLSIMMCFYVSLEQFNPALLAFVVLCLVSLV